MSDLPTTPGGFNVILADPPWNYHAYSYKGEGRSPQLHYATMRLPEIKALPIATVAARDCHLFLWTTGPHLPQAINVIAAWGFRYSAVAFTWVKLWPKAPTLFLDQRSFAVGLGHTTRKNAEFCLLGRRGAPKRASRNVRELIVAPRREHSRKPDETYERIEAYSAGPYLELFSRTVRPGWTQWGNETGRWAA